MESTKKATWKVKASPVPNSDLTISQQWEYTEEDFRTDLQHAREGHPAETNIFSTKMNAAADFWKQMNNPAVLGYATLEFEWNHRE